MTASVTGLFAQTIQADPLRNVAQLSASGSVEVQQDTLSISMTTARDGASAEAVQNQLRQALDSALTQARQSASPGLMDVRTGNFSLYPHYGKDGKINGWQGSTELVLEGKDFSRITNLAAKMQSLTLGSVSFSLSREQRANAEAQAQTQAIERFQAKAGEIAKGFGFGGYALREVAVNANDQGMPRPRMMAMAAKSADMAEAAVPVEAGKSTVVVTISGSVQMTPLPVRP
ncbi:MAG: hypothetical protein JWR68_3397 [Polaromonas sp.]|nr:hypothetical protein [Polaromonas sp.]